MQCKKCLRTTHIKKKIKFITKISEETHDDGSKPVAEKIHVGLELNGFSQVYADVCTYCGMIQHIYI